MGLCLHSSTKIAMLVRIGSGSVVNYIEVEMSDILCLWEKTFYWPDASECSQIATHFHRKFDFFVSIV